jgi:hypothetical protein
MLVFVASLSLEHVDVLVNECVKKKETELSERKKSEKKKNLKRKKRKRI